MASDKLSKGESEVLKDYERRMESIFHRAIDEAAALAKAEIEGGEEDALCAMIQVFAKRCKEPETWVQEYWPPDIKSPWDMPVHTRIKLVAVVAFSGNFGDPEFMNDVGCDVELDVDAAIAELRQAGYEVFRLPDNYGGYLAHPLDNFIEAVIEGPDNDKGIDAIMSEVEAIVSKYGGGCYECGPLQPDHVPFARLFQRTVE